jgi:hypothetical protein
LPTALPQARLPSSFYASRALSRQPPFLDNLTRSTLPIASLASGLPVSYDPNTTQSISLEDSEPTAQIKFHAPMGSTSLDTLRSVRDRGIHTSAPVPSPSPSKPASWWWFQGDNKQNVDSLLEEEDRADSVGEEQSHLRKKCKFSIQIISFSIIELLRRSLSKKSHSLLPRPLRLRHSINRTVHRPRPSNSLARNQRSIRSKWNRGAHNKSSCYK